MRIIPDFKYFRCVTLFFSFFNARHNRVRARDSSFEFPVASARGAIRGKTSSRGRAANNGGDTADKRMYCFRDSNFHLPRDITRDKELSAQEPARLKETDDRGKRTGAVLSARKESSRRDASFHQRRGCGRGV